jgi:hypothetical protein
MRIIALLTMAVAVFAGCSQIQDVTAGHRIRGELHGLWHGAGEVVLQIEANGVITELRLATNGPFQFARLLAPGTPYTVSVSSPVEHECSVTDGGTGMVADVDVTNVKVACNGPPVSISLTSEPSSGPWTWTFDATKETQTFPASLFVEAIALTIDGLVLTGATVNGAPVMRGKATTIELPLGQNKMISVALEWDGRLSKEYQIVFARGSPALDEHVYGKASKPDGNDHFGSSVALSGDTIAVGVPEEEGGAVYVFVRTGTAWSRQGEPLKGTGVSGERFGYAVALSGDTLVVGAPRNSADVGPDPGAVFVFRRDNTGLWHKQAKPLDSGGASDRFGIAVALSGNSVVVGAPGATCDGGFSANAVGTVYAFTCTDTSCDSGVPVPQPGTPGVEDRFGCSLALSSNLLVVGAPGKDILAGAVYAFAGTGTSWAPQGPLLKASNPEGGDEFGASVALSGTTLAVGAPDEDDSSGTVYLFDWNGSSWTRTAPVKAPNAGAHDNFGTSIALSDKMLVVGSPDEKSKAPGIDGDGMDDSVDDAGAAYLFFRTDLMGRSVYIKASNPGMGDHFGTAVAVSRDTLVVGARGEASGVGGICEHDVPDACMTAQADDSAGDAGAIYIFR